LLDGLTGLANRRNLNQRLAAEWSGGARRRDCLALLMIDIDHFKSYNDSQGHSAGDEALRQVAQVINGSIKRSNDFAARYGGEEFAVILPDTDLAAAAQIASAIRQSVLTHAIPRRDADGESSEVDDPATR
jgi:diguanylate cyclase (GGDEF)-like protein